MQVAIAGEGVVDLAILRRLCADAGLGVDRVLWGEGRRTGKHDMDSRLAGWAAGAATGKPFLVLRDLDQDAACAGALRAALIAVLPERMVFRLAVRSAEAWLVADRERLAAHLAVAPSRLAGEPDAIPDPKKFIVDAARKSRRSDIRNGLPPAPGAGRSQGPDYATEIGLFVRDVWRPDAAEAQSDSLRRARLRIGELAARLHTA